MSLPALRPPSNALASNPTISSDDERFTSKTLAQGIKLNIADQLFILRYRSFDWGEQTLHSAGLFWTHQSFNHDSTYWVNEFAQQVLPQILLKLHPSWRLEFSGGIYADYLQSADPDATHNQLHLDLGFIAASSVYFNWDLYSSQLSVAYKQALIKDSAVAANRWLNESTALDFGLDFHLPPEASLHLGLHFQLDPNDQLLHSPVKHLLFMFSWDI